jgi:hypothetical protein
VEHISIAPIVLYSQMEEMEAQVLVSKLGKVGGSLIVDAIGNQALKGGNENDCAITNSK